MVVAEQNLASTALLDAMRRNGWTETGDPSFPWQHPDGTRFSTQAAAEGVFRREMTGSDNPPSTDFDIEDEKEQEAEEADNAESVAEEPPEQEPAPNPVTSWEKIVAQRHIIRSLEGKLLAAKEHQKNCKSEYEGAVSKLMELVDDAEEMEAEPSLFDPQPAINSVASATEVVADPEDDGWRDTSLRDIFIEMPTAVQDALDDLELVRLGDLTNWLNSGKKLTDLPSVGEAKAEKMEKALDRFWERWRNAGTIINELEEPEDGKSAASGS